MKKLIAMLVALMMLTVAAASAESVLCISDPVLVMNTDGEESTIDLTGLALGIAGTEIEDGLAVKIFVTGDGETLYAVDVNLVDSTVLMTATGLSSVLSFAIPADLQAEDVDLSQGFQVPDEVMEKITTILTDAMEVDEENGTIRIPHTAVNDMLTELLPYVDSAENLGVDLEEVKSQLEEMKASDSGVDLVGTFGTDEETGSISAEFAMYAVNNGEVAEESALTLSLVGYDNGFALSVDMGEQGSLAMTYAGGDFALSLTFGENFFSLAGRIEEIEADVEFVALDAEGALDIQTLSEEDSSALGQELMGGLGNLLNYVMQALQPAEEPAA